MNLTMKMKKGFTLIGNRKGFTLIELLVVIAIIGILAALIIVSLSGARAKAQDTQRKNNARNLNTAIEQFYLDQNPSAYPTANTPVDIQNGSACNAPLSSLVGTGLYLTGSAACVDPAGTPLPHQYRSAVSAAEWGIGWQLANQSETAISTGNGVYLTGAAGALTLPNGADFADTDGFGDAQKVFVVYGPQ